MSMKHRLYSQLRHHKSVEFWCRSNTDQADPLSLWKLVDCLLGRGRMLVSDFIDVENFNRFLRRKFQKWNEARVTLPDDIQPCLVRGLHVG